MKPVYFRAPADLRRWLAKHHATARELWVGFHKVGTERPSITWPESVDEALCVGWIDAIRKRVDETRYVIRFCPRRPGSVWSAINIKRVRALTAQGRMRPAGLRAFRARKENRSGIYSYEQRSATLIEPYARRLEANRAAWAFFRAQAPWYQKVVNWWIVSAKLEATRLRRLEQLIAVSTRGRRVPMIERWKPAKAAKRAARGPKTMKIGRR